MELEEVFSPLRRVSPLVGVIAVSIVGLAGCEGGGSLSPTTDPFDPQGATFGDRYWASLAQEYEAFVPPPQLGRAHPPESNIALGRWSDVIDWPQIATGAANLPDGRIMTWSSTGLTGFGGGQAFTHGSIFNPADGSFTTENNPSHNMFCSGLSMLADGSIYAAGGGATITTTSAYADGSWSNGYSMNTARWYPTSATLPSGQVLTALGTNSSGTPEMWTDDQGWSAMPNVSLQSVLDDITATQNLRNWFPSLNVAPDGTLFHAGPTSQMFSLDLSQLNGKTDFGSREPEDHHRLYNSTVMYDIGKLLVAGGGSPAVGTALTIDINNSLPQVSPTSALNWPRSLHNTLVLPNGEVIVIGGTSTGVQFSDNGTALTPEIWNPDSGQWRQVAPHEKPRNYHSTALLLKDGRVAVMGGGLCGGCVTNHKNGEIFEPPYLFDSDGTLAARPFITQGQSVRSAGETLNITGSDDIITFNAVRLAAVTHHYTSDQRFIPLSFQKTGVGTYELDMPDNPNVLVPGFYWVFALNQQGVPSIGYTVRVEVTEPLISTTPQIDPAEAFVNYEYFEGDWNALPDFDQLTPVSTGQHPTISTGLRQQDDYFGFRFSTQIEVPESTDYTFYLSSDDGSRLSIDSQLLIDNDGLHPVIEESASVFLNAGVHDVLVTFFEKQGGQALSVEMSSQQLARQSLNNFLVLQDTPPDPDPEPPVENNGLLVNGGFEDGANGWTVCGGAEGVESSSDSFEGNSAFALSAGACVYQSLAIDEGDEVTLECQAKSDLNGYASMSLAIEDSGFQSLSSMEIPIEQVNYTLYQGEQLAVSGAASAVVTLYSDASALFDQCTVSVNGSVNPDNDPEPDVDPPSDDNLLTNGGFEDDLQSWVSCGDSEAATIVSDAWSGDSALQLTGTTCLYQQLPVAGSGTASFRCHASSGGNLYTSLSVGFSDSGFSSLGNTETEVLTTEYSLHNVSAAIPLQAAFVAVTLYSEENALADNCELVVEP